MFKCNVSLKTLHLNMFLHLKTKPQKWSKGYFASLTSSVGVLFFFALFALFSELTSKAAPARQIIKNRKNKITVIDGFISTPPYAC